MTDNERAQIMKLQKQGYGYKRISTLTGVTVNAVKTFCRRNPVAIEEKPDPICRTCGKKLTILPHTREKLFCSDRCRMTWWNSHPDKVNRKAFYQTTCQRCGVQFEAYGNKNRKFCSRACYALSITKEVQHEQ